VSEQLDPSNEYIRYLESRARTDASVYLGASVQFSTLIVVQLMLANTGAIFTLPAFVEQWGVTDPTAKANALIASGFFVFGVVVALLCAYSAYLNFTWSYENAYREFYVEKLGYDLRMTDVSNLSRRDWLSSQVDQQSKIIKKNKNLVSTTFWTGNVFGVAFGSLLLVGCFWVWGALSS
jgi:hypothetical protein